MSHNWNSVDQCQIEIGLFDFVQQGCVSHHVDRKFFEAGIDITNHCHVRALFCEGSLAGWSLALDKKCRWTVVTKVFPQAYTSFKKPCCGTNFFEHLKSFGTRKIQFPGIRSEISYTVSKSSKTVSGAAHLSKEKIHEYIFQISWKISILKQVVYFSKQTLKRTTIIFVLKTSKKQYHWRISSCFPYFIGSDSVREGSAESLQRYPLHATLRQIWCKKINNFVSNLELGLIPSEGSASSGALSCMTFFGSAKVQWKLDLPHSPVHEYVPCAIRRRSC